MQIRCGRQAIQLGGGFSLTIKVKVGTEHSEVYHVENIIPQGSVCSPVIFNVMINYMFEEIDTGIGKSLYADDGLRDRV